MLKWISDPVVFFWRWHKPSVSSLQFGDPKLPCCLPFAGCYRLADCARVLKRVTQEQQWLSFKVGGGRSRCLVTQDDIIPRVSHPVVCVFERQHVCHHSVLWLCLLFPELSSVMWLSASPTPSSAVCLSVWHTAALQLSSETGEVQWSRGTNCDYELYTLSGSRHVAADAIKL